MKNRGSFGSHMKASGCSANVNAKVVVPAFSAPTIRKFGNTLFPELV